MAEKPFFPPEGKNALFSLTILESDIYYVFLIVACQLGI